MRDIHSNIKADLLFIKGRTALGVSGSTCVDLQGYEGAEVVLGFKGSGATYVAANCLKFTILHGDTSTSATGVVGTDDLIGNGHTSGVILNLNTEAKATAQVALGCERWGYKGGKRYLRVRYTASGTATSATGANTVQFSGVVIKGRPALAPVANEA